MLLTLLPVVLLLLTMLLPLLMEPLLLVLVPLLGLWSATATEAAVAAFGGLDRVGVGEVGF